MDAPFAEFLDRIHHLVPDMQRRAPDLDAAGEFPASDVSALQAAGALTAPLPRPLGGLGLGTEPAAAAATLEFFRLLGSGNLAVGRVVEAHVNAVRLAARYGGAALCRDVAQDCAEGRLIALWVTDPPNAGLAFSSTAGLNGAKQFCSGAGYVRRAVVTAEQAGQTFLAYAELDDGTTVTPLPGSLAGMRAARTGQVAFTNVTARIFGRGGDYLREPDFSCGAWRTAAVTLGGLDTLAGELRLQLVARERHGDPHQQARVGASLIAAETARLWMQEAARRAERDEAGPEDITYVGLARLAVERACLDVIELVQRSLGISAFLRANPAERLCRDLATYLRQPAADMVLTEAAAAAMQPPLQS